MFQTPEAQAFVARVVALPKGPSVSLDEVLQPSLDDETELRHLFATDRANPRLSNPYVGLVDIFDAPPDIRTTRARVVGDEEDSKAKYVMPLKEDKRRKEGEPCIVADLDEFRRNWSIFTEGALSQLTDWSNVVAAGGSVQACLAPLAEEDKASKRATRKHYHSAAYPTSDVDLFLWGLTPEQAEKKIITIYEAVRDSIPWDVTCVRTKSTISIHSQYPYRSVQIVLRLYHSPAEILAGFDIDAPCCAYDGTCVWANPRAIVAMMRQCNTTDVTRRSPSYEVRLFKYSKRGFEVYVPSLVRLDIDPTIFERSIIRIEGLARLLVLERLADPDRRQAFLQNRRTLRGRPPFQRRYGKMKRKYKNDLKLDQMEQLEMNDYDVGSLHIPYGPGWDARRIDKLIYQTDLGMNSTFNPKNNGRRLHRHPAFFGTIEECIEDCCEHCPEPIDEAERELQAEEDETYIRGRLAFMKENPGRQVITGSFKPIDVGEWSAQVYVGPTERFFGAIAAHDMSAVAEMIKDGVDPNRRDHVGRSPLHFAIMCNATEIACDLVDAGARMTARVVDGKTSLHLAIQRDQPTVVRKLLEKSAQNKERTGTQGKSESEEEEKQAKGDERERLSSEDDWSSEDDDAMEVNDDEEADDEGSGEDAQPKKGNEEEDMQDAGTTNTEGIPDDNDDEPDVFDLTVVDWDNGLTPLAYAAIFASLPIIEDLIAAGADVTASTKNAVRDVHPLLLTAVRTDEDEACRIAERLILAGATSSPADTGFTTIFWRMVANEKVKVVSTILRCDPNASSVVNFPSIQWNCVVLPLILAIRSRRYALVATLLAYGAKLTVREEDITKALQSRPLKERAVYVSRTSDLVDLTYLPVETAVARRDDLVRLLIALGAEVNSCIQETKRRYIQEDQKKTVLDWVTFAVRNLDEKIEKERKEDTGIEQVDLSKATNWKEYAVLAGKMCVQPPRNEKRKMSEKAAMIERMEYTKKYLEDVKDFLLSAGGKTYAELKGLELTKSSPQNSANDDSMKERTIEDYNFLLMSPNRYLADVTKREAPEYHELFQACFAGDDEKIQTLCLPPGETEGVSLPLLLAAQLAVPQKMHSYMTLAKTGITPFSIAVARRKWDTARLILAITLAQYDQQEQANEFSTDDIELDDNSSDHGSDYSDDSDMTINQRSKENYYVDIAKRPSAVKCNVNPAQLFTTSSLYGHIANSNYVEETPLTNAIREGDVEKFVELLNMTNAFNIHLKEAEDLVDAIIKKDNPEMLDTLIRHTGVGIDLDTVRHVASDAISRNDGNRLYLGLNVHGKKRMDLARKHDPGALHNSQRQFPLLWRSLAAGSENVVDYLGTEKPYTAYRAYSMGHNDERAERLRMISLLKELLPQWIGFKVNSLGESPLTVAVLSGKIVTVKFLFARHRQLMKVALHEKWTVENLNMLHIAVRARKTIETELLDFLLAKNISPLETDQNGFNIYHSLCSTNNCRLLQHLLENLPADVNESLLTQQTRNSLQTPLHIASERGALKAVEMILARSNAATMIRDSDGCLPLHVAILKCYCRITRMLVNASPSTLLVENGVGNTPFETISGIRSQWLMNSVITLPCVENLVPSSVDENTERFDLSRLERELPLLRQTIDSLMKEGKLRKDTKLEQELVAFADMMEGHVRRLQRAPEIVKKSEEPKEDEYDKKDMDPSSTYRLIQEAQKSVQGRRELVHLIDVQKSVDRNLNIYESTKQKTATQDDGFGLREEAVYQDRSFVRDHIQ